MITSGSFSFISYNSKKFLEDTLTRMQSNGTVYRAYAVFHEYASSGNGKDHWHVYVEAARRIDTSKIQEEFIEIIENGVQSIAIKPRCKSKFNDFYLYAIHDLDYLKFKNLEREEVNILSGHIAIGDFKEDIATAIAYLNKCCVSPYRRLRYLIEDGYTLEEIYDELRTPFGQMRSVANAYHTIKKQVDEENHWIQTKIDYALAPTEEISPFTDKQ